jgi:hypothetical protein
MKKVILILTLVSSMASAQTIITQSGRVITPGGSYIVSTPVTGSTTYITQTAGSNTTSNYSQVVPAVPVTVNPITGIGQVITPNGSYLVQQIGSTTSVIQTSKSR